MKRRSKPNVARFMVSFACALGLAAYVAVVTVAMGAEWGDQLQTTAEVVKLRSTCAELGQRILESNFIRSAVYQEQFSRYSPRTNRCYVEMRIQTDDPNQHSNRFGQYLYDGQTSEMLAFAQIQNGKKSGKVFDLLHRTTSFENGGWDDASEYIYAMMRDDRG